MLDFIIKYQGALAGIVLGLILLHHSYRIRSLAGCTLGCVERIDSEVAELDGEVQRLGSSASYIRKDHNGHKYPIQGSNLELPQILEMLTRGIWPGSKESGPIAISQMTDSHLRRAIKGIEVNQYSSPAGAKFRECLEALKSERGRRSANERWSREDPFSHAARIIELERRIQRAGAEMQGRGK